MSRITKPFFFAAIFILSGVFTAPTLLGAEVDPRLVVPDSAARTAAMKVAQEAFAPDMRAARSPAERSAVAKKMLQTAEDSKAVAADWYVLLDLARTTAATVPDAETAFLAIDRMNASFVVDAVGLSAETLTTLAAATRTTQDRAELLTAAQAAVGRAVVADRYDVATSITKLGLAQARKSGDIAAIKTWQTLSTETESLAKSYAEVVAALKVLEQKPDDPAANFTIGSYRCFDKGLWEEGLPFLARGNNAAVSNLAKRDLAGANDPATQSALGDAWWDLAATRPSHTDAMRHRAKLWYRKVLPTLAGLERVKIERRISEPDVKSHGSSGTVNLLALFPKNATAIDGKWDMSSRGLEALKGGRLLFGYAPPEEYDLSIEFSRNTGNDACAVICPMPQGGSLFWEAGGWGNHVIGFTEIAGDTWSSVTKKEMDSAVKNGARCSALIHIRRESTTAIFNGKPVSEITEGKKIFGAGDDEIGGQRVIGVFFDGNSSATVYKLEIREITGRGAIVGASATDKSGEPLASLQFVENMGYTIGELRKGTSTHNNDDYPLTEIPAAMVGKPFTEFVAGKPGPVSFKFTTRGKIYILAVVWPGYASQAAVLKGIAKKEPMRVVGTKETFEVWSITAEAGKRIDLPFQEILVADHVEKVVKLEDR